MNEPIPSEQTPAAPPSAGRQRPGLFAWIALTVTAVALLSSIAWPIAAVFIFKDFQDSQEELEHAFGGPDPGYYVDDEGVLEAVEEPCAAMVKAGERLTLVGDKAKVAESLNAWANAAGGIVTAIDGADPDRDSEEWRDDWKATIAAVQKYAKNVGKPGNRLVLPDTLDQMYWATDAECGVPISIAGLDRRYAGRMLGGGEF